MGLRFDNSERKMYAVNSENIVKKEMEKLGLPENTVAEIMGFHGGVLGMVPREVWDWECQPLCRDPKSPACDVVDVSGEDSCFDEISSFIRNGNWSLHSKYLKCGGTRGEGYFISIKVNKKNIRDVINGGAVVDFVYTTRAGKAKRVGLAKITGYRKGVVELTETEYSNSVPKTSKHRCALSSFEHLGVAASYKFVEYERDYEWENGTPTFWENDSDDSLAEAAFL
jgi:hypothetical protein